MSFGKQIKKITARRLEKLRLRLAVSEAVGFLTVLGFTSGIVAGAVMVVFRLVIESPQIVFLGPDNPDDYEHLAPVFRLLLPTLGGLLVGVFFYRLAKAEREVGIVHVMERMAYGEGLLPLKNAGVQFLSAAVCFVAGHSVGREGPAVHIGAACGSWMGQRLRLPNNSIRVLVGCGTAGAIAAAFNTPLAGVIFAMEVIMTEYTIASFMPIILAAVSANTVSRGVLASMPTLALPSMGFGSLSELVYIALLGILVGALASLFVQMLVFISKWLSHHPVWLRMTLAGALTGLLALPAPEIMGAGYDTMRYAVLGEFGLAALLTILACKVAATALGLGLGLPGGIIGPTLIIGAVAGSALGALFDLYAPGSISPTLYALLGMGAMMGATLNAPLAALTALLEFTADPQIILPGMLAIVTAGLTCQQALKTPSVFLKLMQTRGVDYSIHPLASFLSRLGVTSCMERKVHELPRVLERKRLSTILSMPLIWLLIRDPESRPRIVFAADVARYLEAHPEETNIDLFEIPSNWLDAAPISAQATLLGALQTMDRKKVNALYIAPLLEGPPDGVITRENIERSYRYVSGS